MAPPIRVLVVDDSAVFRMVLARVLGRTPGFEVVGMAIDGHEALDAAARLQPDVVTLDVEMPGLDGVATLGRLLARRPTRVVMLSRATRAGAEVTIEALRMGAVDAIAKPDAAWGSGPSPFVDDLLAKIRAAALVPLALVGPASPDRIGSEVPATRRTQGPLPVTPARPGVARRLVVVVTSTGGPRALESLLGGLPRPLGAGLIVVQHMLTGFTATLSARLDRLGALDVREAQHGDRVIEDLALVAPGDWHVLVDAVGHVSLSDSGAVNGLRPAADVTLLAAAPAWGPRLLSVVLTGMGRDGTEGSRAVRAHGGWVIAQDEATSSVFGMPRAVADAHLANRVLALDEVAAAIADWAGAGGPVPDGPTRRAATDLRNSPVLADT